MRTLGPRSISSFLKVFLDISFGFIALFLLSLGAIALWSALHMANPALPTPTWHWGPNGPPMFVASPRGASGLPLFALYMLGLLGIVGRLRKIFITLVAGQPFQAENARRLRIIGLILAALEVSRYAVWAILLLCAPDSPVRDYRPNIDVVGLFAIGVMFVLAEVFDEGVKMRKDLDLTI